MCCFVLLQNTNIDVLVVFKAPTDSREGGGKWACVWGRRGKDACIKLIKRKKAVRPGVWDLDRREMG